MRTLRCDNCCAEFRDWIDARNHRIDTGHPISVDDHTSHLEFWFGLAMKAIAAFLVLWTVAAILTLVIGIAYFELR